MKYYRIETEYRDIEFLASIHLDNWLIPGSFRFHFGEYYFCMYLNVLCFIVGFEYYRRK